MKIDNIFFLLNFSNNKYEINEAKIADLDVVKTIIITKEETIAKFIYLKIFSL